MCEECEGVRCGGGVRRSVRMGGWCVCVWVRRNVRVGKGG